MTCSGSFDELNWDGGTDQDFTLFLSEGDSTDAWLWALRMFSDDANWPGSGSGKELTYSLTANMQYGPGRVIVFFLSGVDDSESWANYLIGTDSHSGISTDWTCDSLGSVGAGDMGFIFFSEFGNAVESTPAASGQTEIYESYDTGQWAVGAAYELAEDQLTVEGYFGMYSTGIAFAIKAAAGGSSSSQSSDSSESSTSSELSSQSSESSSSLSSESSESSTSSDSTSSDSSESSTSSESSLSSESSDSSDSSLSSQSSESSDSSESSLHFPTTEVIEAFTGVTDTTPPNSNWTNV